MSNTIPPSSSHSLQEKFDDLLVGMNQVKALVNLAMSARFSELDDANIFYYFMSLSDIIEQAKHRAKK